MTSNLASEIEARITLINRTFASIAAFMRAAEGLDLRDASTQMALAVRIVEDLESLRMTATGKGGSDAN